MIRRLKTKYGVFLSILVLFSIVVTLSYSAFIFSTGKYRSTELLISKLNYGITITEDKTNLSSISGSKVTVPKGSITYYNIVISSINKIDSKYTLAYKTDSNAVVKYTDRTPWNTSGYIKGYDENTYSKRIRVVIDNSSSTTSSTVDFAVYGGYTFNTYASIELSSGYVTVTGPYTEELASLSNRLVDIVENDTGCVTSDKDICLYGGDSIKNYVQYPIDEDTTNGNIGESAFNISSNSPKYVGYKYGEDISLDTIRNNTTDSTIKTTIDTWYKNNLINYTKFLSTSAVYCNDRSLGTGQTYSASSSSSFNFAPYYRMDYDTKGAKANPSYNCRDIRDAFSVNNTSAKLDFPIGLMTADEIAFAGGVASVKMNTPYAWFISNSAGTQVSSYWWSLSPSGWNGYGSVAWFWHSNNAILGYNYIDCTFAVRPAISLKSCNLISGGDGSANNPYVINTDGSTC